MYEIYIVESRISVFIGVNVGEQRVFAEIFAFFRRFSKFSCHNSCFLGGFYGIFNMVGACEDY
jgi:hypothetical protein